MARIVLNSHHATALVLRVDEMVRGEVGPVARQVGEIELQPGRNEVDQDLWRAWLEHHKDGPLAASISEEKEREDGTTEKPNQ